MIILVRKRVEEGTQEFFNIRETRITNHNKDTNINYQLFNSKNGYFRILGIKTIYII